MTKLDYRHMDESSINSKRFAKIISIVFNPLIVPSYVFIGLLFGTYINVLTLTYRLIILAIVASFTFIVPLLSNLFLKYYIQKSPELKSRLRFLSSLFLLISNVFCWLLLLRLSTPWYMSGIILSNISAYLIAFLLNFKWPVSFHTVTAATLVGYVVVFDLFFDYNPLFLLSFFIFVCGLVAFSRMELKRYSLNVVMLSFFLGISIVILVLHPSVNYLLRYLF